MLRITHKTAVTEDQIDHLGHMNVRYYGQNAMAATRSFLSELSSWDDRGFEVRDIYTRHHREQLLGTSLEVRSAVLGADHSSLRLHHELRASDSDTLAATFVHTVHPVNVAGTPGTLDDAVLAAAAATRIEQPDYAATRTISLRTHPIEAAPSLAVVRDRDLAMRKERAIDAVECDENGRYLMDMAPMLIWGGEPVRDDRSDMFHEEDGRMMAWANMESRVSITRVPEVGTRIQSFSAVVGVADKVTHNLNWVYDLDREELLAAFATVGLAFDINARRPMSIPDRVRQRYLANLHTDLAPPEA